MLYPIVRELGRAGHLNNVSALHRRPLPRTRDGRTVRVATGAPKARGRLSDLSTSA